MKLRMSVTNSIKEEIIFVLGSASATVMYKAVRGELKVTQFVQQKSFRHSRITQTDHFVQEALDTIDFLAKIALEEIVQKSLKIPQSITVYYAGPWSDVQIGNIEESFTNTRLFTQKSYENVLGKLDEKCEQLIQSAVTHEKENENDLLICNKECISIALNGYVIKNPVGKHYNTVSGVGIIATIEKMLQNKIEHVLARHFSDRPVQHKAIVADIIRKQLTQSYNFTGIIIHIGGELTDLFIFRQGKIIKYAQIQLGSRANQPDSLVHKIVSEISNKDSNLTQNIAIFYEDENAHEMLEKSIIQSSLSVQKNNSNCTISTTDSISTLR